MKRICFLFPLALAAALADAGDPLEAGDRRLAVRFDPATGWPCAYRLGEKTLLASDGESPAPIAIGLEHFKIPTAENARSVRRTGAFRRLSENEAQSSTIAGDWQIDTYVKLFPERRMVRRRFDITWCGAAATGKLERVWVSAGKMPCRDGQGGYLLPGRFPRASRAARAFKPGRAAFTDIKFGSHTPVIACGSDGWAVLSANDETVPWGERTQSMAIERTDGVAIATCFECYGWMPRGVKQTFGDQWLCFTPGDCEAALRRTPAWFEAVGQHVPVDRFAAIKDVAIYSDHPGYCGEFGPAKLGFNRLGDHLPFIRELGFNTVWLRPVEDKSPYNPDDYYRLQSDIGTEEDFKNYVNKAHALGLKVWRDAVSHGGRNDTVRARAHPEWLAYHEDGTSDGFWCYDFFAPGWIESMRTFVRHETQKYGLDGWRMDAPSGSRYPNWSRAIPYARASFAQTQGSLAMTRTIRAGLREVRPAGATLCEAHINALGTTADAIYDNWGVAQIFLSTLAQGDIAATVDDYRRHLHERQWSGLTDLVLMRYAENHDHLSAASLYGKLPALAAFAVQAWIAGIPCVRETIEEGSFEEYRAILRTRAALEELRRGEVDYLAPDAPPGVFACRRWTRELESHVYVNFNPTSVVVRGASLLPYGYRVVRTRGPSVAEALGELPPVAGQPSSVRPLEGVAAARIFKLDLGDGNSVDVRAELRNDPTEWITRGDYELRLTRTETGWTLAAFDAKGRPMRNVKLFVQIPAAVRWYAKTAEGDFDNPQYVRCPVVDARDAGWSTGHSPTHGARRWSNRSHPFGFTRARAAVGGILADGTALELTGFREGDSVDIRERIRNDAGFTVVLAGGDPSVELTVKTPPRGRVNTGSETESITGDPRLAVCTGGWLWDDGRLRVRVRRTGAIDGVWKRTDTGWTHVLRLAECVTTTGTGGAKNCIGMTTRLCRQRNDNDPQIVFSRKPDGTVEMAFFEVWLRGGAADSGKMKVPIVCTEKLTFGRSDGFGLSFSLTTGRALTSAEGELRYEFNGCGPAAREPAFTLEDLTFTGSTQGTLERSGNSARVCWLRAGGPNLPAVTVPSGFACFLRVAGRN